MHDSVVLGKKHPCWVMNTTARSCPVFPVLFVDHRSHHGSARLMEVLIRWTVPPMVQKQGARASVKRGGCTKGVWAGSPFVCPHVLLKRRNPIHSFSTTVFICEVLVRQNGTSSGPFFHWTVPCMHPQKQKMNLGATNFTQLYYLSRSMLPLDSPLHAPTKTKKEFGGNKFYPASLSIKSSYLQAPSQ